MLRLTIGLLRREINALLLLERAKGLPIAALQQIGERRLIGQTLLPSKVRLRNAATVAAKSTGRNRVAFKGRTLRGSLFLLQGLLCLDDVLQIGRHILVDLLARELGWIDCLRSTLKIIRRLSREPGASAKASHRQPSALRHQWRRGSRSVAQEWVGLSSIGGARLSGLLNGGQYATINVTRNPSSLSRSTKALPKELRAHAAPFGCGLHGLALDRGRSPNPLRYHILALLN